MSAELDVAAGRLAELSGWIDGWVAASTEAEQLWGRTAKIAEEHGEVVKAIIGYLSQNPRKGEIYTLDGVVDELLDVAVTALGAVESIRGNDGRALSLLTEKIGAVHGRLHRYRGSAVPA